MTGASDECADGASNAATCPDISVRNIGFFGRNIDDKTNAAMTAHHAGDA